VLAKTGTIHDVPDKLESTNENEASPNQVMAWGARALGHVRYGLNKFDVAINSVDGLSALVRVATSVSNAFAVIAQYFPQIFGSVHRFTQSEFDALVGGTRVVSDVAYFSCDKVHEDIQKRRYVWVVGSFFSAVANIGRCAIWLKDLGREGLYHVLDAASSTALLRWSKMVSATAVIGLCSIGGSLCRGVQRCFDIHHNYRTTYAAVDLFSQVSEIALSVSEFLPVIPVVPAVLGLVAAGTGVVSYFTDICTKEEKVTV
jgi:hypothetical protein